MKAFAHNDPRLRNASVEFDIETLSPTYRLTIGLPGQSNAIAIARRLGLRSIVLERASEQLSPQHFELETLLDEIRSERAAASEARSREEAARKESEDLRRELSERRDPDRTGSASNILNDAKRDAEDMLVAMRREMDQEHSRIATRSFDTRAADETLNGCGARQSRRPGAPPATDHPGRSARAGCHPQRPGWRDIPQEGVAMSTIDDAGRIEVQFGSIGMKVTVEPD